MPQISFGERMSKLFGIILTSPFFISLFIIAILTMAILIVNAKVKDKLVRIISALGYTCIIAFIFIQYGASVITLSDNLFQNIFSTIYFPSLISYICMILAAVLLLIRTMVNNKISTIMKLSNVAAFIIILFLFILTMDVIIRNSIDIYSKAAVYTNESLVVLIQSSMGVFAIWLILILIDSVIKALVKNSEREVTPNKIDNKSIKMLKNVFKKKENENEIGIVGPYVPEPNSLEEISVLTESDFYKGLAGFQKKQSYKTSLKNKK